MADPINASTSPAQQSGADQPASAQQPDGAVDESKNSKGWEAAKAQKDRADALARELDAIKADRVNAENENLKQKGEFKTLYEQEKAKREAIEQKSARVLKRSALQGELSNLGVTYDPRVLELGPLDQLEIDASGERVTNAALIAAEFVKASPLLFAKNGKSGTPFETPQPNPGGGSQAGIDLSKFTTREEHHAAARRDPKGYAEAIRVLASGKG